jgi:Zn-dependent M16 (insulinase) family peptidase
MFQLESFKLIQEQHLPSMRLVFNLFEHQSGAQHIHIYADDIAKIFSISFKTKSFDSSGVAHLLEHMCVSRSGNSKIGNIMTYLSENLLCSEVNGLTLPDITSYYFCNSYSSKYIESVRLVLDSVFHPNLSEENFYREIYSSIDMGDRKGRFGPIINEMISAHRNPDYLLDHIIRSNLFEQTHLRNFSGGRPNELLDISLEKVRKFHIDNYQPFNCLTYSYGNIDPKILLNLITSFIQSKNNTKIDEKITKTQSKVKRKGNTLLHFYDRSFSSSRYFSRAWKVKDSLSFIDDLKRHIIADTIFGSVESASSQFPLRKKMLELSKTSTISTASGYNSSFPDPYMCVSLKYLEKINIEILSKFFEDSIYSLTSNRIEEKELEKTIDRHEMRFKEYRNLGYPFGYRLFNYFRSQWTNHRSIFDALDIDNHLEILRSTSLEDFNKSFFDIFRYESYLDMALMPRKSDKKPLNFADGNQNILLNVLDKVNYPTNYRYLENKKLNLLELTERFNSELDFSNFSETENVYSCKMEVNDISYCAYIFDITNLDDEKLFYMTLLCNCLMRGKISNTHITQKFNLMASVVLTNSADNLNIIRKSLIIHCKCLKKDRDECLSYLYNKISEFELSPSQLLRNASQNASRMSSHLKEHTNHYAYLLAGAKISHVTKLKNIVSGIPQIAFLRKISQFPLKKVEILCENLVSLLRICVNSPKKILLIGYENQSVLKFSSFREFSANWSKMELDDWNLEFRNAPGMSSNAFCISGFCFTDTRSKYLDMYLRSLHNILRSTVRDNFGAYFVTENYNKIDGIGIITSHLNPVGSESLLVFRNLFYQNGFRYPSESEFHQSKLKSIDLIKKSPSKFNAILSHIIRLSAGYTKETFLNKVTDLYNLEYDDFCSNLTNFTQYQSVSSANISDSSTIVVGSELI